MSQGMYDVTLTITVTADDEAEAADRVDKALLAALKKDAGVKDLVTPVIRGWSDATVEVES